MSLREQSIIAAEELGYAVNRNLPLLEDTVSVRSASDVVDRTLCLYASTAVAYGLPRTRASEWAEREGISSALSESERALVVGHRSPAESDRQQVEAIFTLLWASSHAPTLDFGKVCPSTTVTWLPDLKVAETSVRFRKATMMRSADEILEAADLAYLIHSAVVEAVLNDGRVPGRVPAHVVIQRRTALEWLIGTEAWDDVTLDT